MHLLQFDPNCSELLGLVVPATAGSGQGLLRRGASTWASYFSKLLTLERSLSNKTWRRSVGVCNRERSCLASRTRSLW